MRYDMAIKVKFKKNAEWTKKMCVVFDVAKKVAAESIFRTIVDESRRADSPPSPPNC